MSTTSSPAGRTPHPPTYPAPPGRLGHRWRPGTLVLIIAVVLLIAVVVVGAIVWSRGPSQTPLPNPGKDGGLLIQSPAQPASMSGGGLPRAAGPGAPAGLTYSAGPAGVDVGDGLSITPAPGWVVDDQGDHYVNLFNEDIPALMVVMVGKLDETTNIDRLLLNDINGYSYDQDMTNLHFGGFGEPEPLEGNNFDQYLDTDYTATIWTQQGTMTIYGIFVELLSTSTGESAFIDLSAPSEEALEASLEDASAMLASMT